MTIGLIYPEYRLATNRHKLLIIVLFSLLTCHSIKGQQYDSLTHLNVYVVVEEMPEYNCGIKGFMQDFGKNFHYSFDEDKPIQTRLLFQFVIDTEGNLVGARIHNKTPDEYTSFEKAGLKALKLMQNWQPGSHKGESVNVLITKSINVNPSFER